VVDSLEFGDHCLEFHRGIRIRGARRGRAAEPLTESVTGGYFASFREFLVGPPDFLPLARAVVSDLSLRGNGAFLP